MLNMKPPKRRGTAEVTVVQVSVQTEMRTRRRKKRRRRKDIQPSSEDLMTVGAEPVGGAPTEGGVLEIAP
jgi:hypothetical protein